ncbi:uncharacterized [Tachysurus ichikawai]
MTTRNTRKPLCHPSSSRTLRTAERLARMSVRPVRQATPCSCSYTLLSSSQREHRCSVLRDAILSFLPQHTEGHPKKESARCGIFGAEIVLGPRGPAASTDVSQIRMEAAAPCT